MHLVFHRALWSCGFASGVEAGKFLSHNLEFLNMLMQQRPKFGQDRVQLGTISRCKGLRTQMPDGVFRF